MDYILENDANIEFDVAGEESADELNVNLDSIHQAVIWGSDWTTETINIQMVKQNIDLSPDFQRRDAWTNQDKSRLIESLIMNIPVPPIILAENKQKRNSYIVIDGKQRLLSISRFYGDAGFEPLKLSGLTVLKELNGKVKEQISEELIRSLENQTIRTIIIRNWPDEAFLYTVFLRLNTGSKKLSPQELRQALKPGKFLKYLDDATANSVSIKKMLNNKKADPRMKDVELALRYFAFKYFITEFNGDLKMFLDNTCDRLNQLWDDNHFIYEQDFKELENAINLSYLLIDNGAPFSRFENGFSSRRFNRSIFELFSYYFCNEQIRTAVQANKDLFKESFMRLNDDSAFISSISDTTKDPEKVVKRFELFATLLHNVTGQKVTSFELNSGKISLCTIG
ncbi:MAG: DUF262 domain-containing protein [Christensenellales bacterium]